MNLLFLLAGYLASMPAHAQALPPQGRCAGPAILEFSLQRIISRSRTGHTQGLIFDNGRLIESTGGHSPDSVLNVIDINSGTVSKVAETAESAFGEGITRVGNELIQLTYLEKKILVYDAKTFQLKHVGSNVFSASGQGWGIATLNNETLIASDGSDNLFFLDAKTFALEKTLPVKEYGIKRDLLNHIVKIDNHVFANIYEDYNFSLNRIDLNSGCVDGILNLKPLMAELPKEDLLEIATTQGRGLNGAAYNPDTREMFVTGKGWSRIFVIKLSRP